MTDMKFIITDEELKEYEKFLDAIKRFYSMTQHSKERWDDAISSSSGSDNIVWSWWPISSFMDFESIDDIDEPFTRLEIDLKAMSDTYADGNPESSTAVDMEIIIIDNALIVDYRVATEGEEVRNIYKLDGIKAFTMVMYVLNRVLAYRRADISLLDAIKQIAFKAAEMVDL